MADVRVCAISMLDPRRLIKSRTGAQRFPPVTLPTKSWPSLCVGRAQKSGPVCCAKGTGYAVFMVSQAGEMTNEMPAHSESSVIRATESSGRYLVGSYLSSQTVLLSGRMPGCRRFPMICVTSTEPGLVRV